MKFATAFIIPNATSVDAQHSYIRGARKQQEANANRSFNDRALTSNADYLNTTQLDTYQTISNATNYSPNSTKWFQEALSQSIQLAGQVPSTCDKNFFNHVLLHLIRVLYDGQTLTVIYHVPSGTVITSLENNAYANEEGLIKSNSFLDTVYADCIDSFKGGVCDKSLSVLSRHTLP